MDGKKVKQLDDKDYEEFIKELVGNEEVEVAEPQKKD